MIYKLYNGLVELDYEDKRHLYKVLKIDGIPVNKKADGVTGVLNVISKPALMYWAVNQTIAHLEMTIKPGDTIDEVKLKEILQEAKYAHRKRSQEAASIGDMVHDWIDRHIKGEKPTPFVNEVMRASCEQFLNWEREHKVKFLENEKIIYSRKLNYAGTFDFLCEIDRQVWIGDIKTSSGIWDEYWFQTAAYRQAHTEEYPDVKIRGEVIVRVGKDGSLEVKRSTDEYVTPYFINKNAFNHALKLHRTLNQLKDYKYAEKNGEVKKIY